MNALLLIDSQFLQIALPIMITFIAAAWLNGKRFDDFKGDINRRLDEIVKRLDGIERLLTDHTSRITVLEERTSPLRVRG